MQGGLPVIAHVGVNAHLVKHHARVLRRDGIVVHHQHLQGAGVDFPAADALLAVAQAHDDREFRADALFRFDLDAAVHHLHDVLRDGHAEAGAAVLALAAAVLLGEGVEDFGDEGRVHADARVLDAEFHRGLLAEDRRALHRQGDLAGGVGKLDGVGEDVDQNLLELHVVADIIVVHLAHDAAFVAQPLVAALGHDHGVDLLQNRAEGEHLIAQHHPSGLDAAHVENVVDEPQQVLCALAGLGQVFPRLGRERLILEGETVQADDGVHGGADLMAHAREKGRFGAVGLPRRVQGLHQHLALLHGFAHFRVDHREADAHGVDDVVVPVGRVAHARHAQHFIIICAVSVGEIAVGDDVLGGQRAADALR